MLNVPDRSAVLSRIPVVWSLAVCLVVSLASPAASVRYELRIENNWSSTTHPDAFPEQAHFSWLGGATHASGANLWEPGSLASPGIVEMAETGRTDILMEEVDAAIAAGSAGSRLDWPWHFCPAEITGPQCGATRVVLDVDEQFPYVTLATMLGPSPDWFVGVSGLPLRLGDVWLPRVVIDLRPLDGGTRSANAVEMAGPLTLPPDPVSLITEASGQIIGTRSLGTLTFTLLRPCNDGLDNDGDGRIDYPVDPGCARVSSVTESPACQDGVNNDPGRDVFIDFDGGASAGLPLALQTAPDPDCEGNPARRSESRKACGLGWELALLVPALWVAGTRRG